MNANIIWQWLPRRTAATHMIFTNIDEYNLILIAVLGCNVYGKITVANVKLPKAVLSSVKIFAVYIAVTLSWHKYISFDWLHFFTITYDFSEKALLTIKMHNYLDITLYYSNNFSQNWIRFMKNLIWIFDIV